MKRYLIFLQLFMCFLFAGRAQICLDPGHGGTASGTKNPRYGQNGPYEKDFNLEIGQIMADDLSCQVRGRSRNR